MSDSRYGGTLGDFERAQPRVYGKVAGPGEEPEPATAHPAQHVPEPRPNASTIEGAIAGLGLMASAAVSDDPIVRRRARPLVLIARVTIAAIAVGLLIALLLR